MANRKPDLSLTEENYLKALLHLSGDNDEIGTKDVSVHLAIKMPTVTAMMKRLAEKKLVTYESYKPIKLTALGRKTAGLILRKHRLTEMFLVDVMKFGWEEVHDIAEQVEHVRSPAFFERMDRMLGHPKIDPHGSPIPDREGKIHAHHYIRLSDVSIGKTVTLSAISDSSHAFLEYLNSKNLHLGSRIKILSVESFDRSMTVSYANHKNEVLSPAACERMLVK